MSYENETTNQLINDNNMLNDNVIFWSVLADGNDLNRLDIIMEDAKNILAEYGNVNILLKPYTENTDDSCTTMTDYNDAYLSFLLRRGAQHAMRNIEEDETMEDVTVISEPTETYNPIGNNLHQPVLVKNYMIKLYLQKNDYTIN